MLARCCARAAGWSTACSRALARPRLSGLAGAGRRRRLRPRRTLPGFRHRSADPAADDAAESRPAGTARTADRPFLGHRPRHRPQRAHRRTNAWRKPARDITVQTALLEARLLCRQRAACSTTFEQAPARQPRSAGLLQGQAAGAARALRALQRNPLQPGTQLQGKPGRPARPADHPVDRRAAGSAARWERSGADTASSPREEARQLERAESFLRDLRIRLHQLAGRREDRLLFDHQEALAAAVRLRRDASQARLRTADAALLPQRQAVTQLNTLLLQNSAPRSLPARAGAADRHR